MNIFFYKRLILQIPIEKEVKQSRLKIILKIIFNVQNQAKIEKP